MFVFILFFCIFRVINSITFNFVLKMHGKNSDFISGSIDLIAGSLGGCANVLIGQPLDTVKVKMQTFPHLYRNSWLCFKSTLIKDGLRMGLYAGTTPALAANVAENSVLFCAYGFCKKGVQMITGNEKPKPIENAVAGFAAAFFSSFTLCPTELIKCKLQALRETNSSQIGAFQLTASIIRSEGFRGMFRGLTPTFYREMPGYFFFFGGYEFSKSLLTKGKPENADLLTTIIAGGIGGICLWTSIFPFDVAKSKVQVTGSKEAMLTVMRNIVRKEGISGLYNGLVPTLLRTFPSTGGLFVAYEYSKYYLEQGAQRFL